LALGSSSRNISQEARGTDRHFHLQLVLQQRLALKRLTLIFEPH